MWSSWKWYWKQCDIIQHVFVFCASRCLQTVFCASRCLQTVFCASRCLQTVLCASRCLQTVFCASRCLQTVVGLRSLLIHGRIHELFVNSCDIYSMYACFCSWCYICATFWEFVIRMLRVMCVSYVLFIRRIGCMLDYMWTAYKWGMKYEHYVYHTLTILVQWVIKWSMTTTYTTHSPSWFSESLSEVWALRIPHTHHLGSEPTIVRILSAIRPCRFHFSMAAAQINTPISIILISYTITRIQHLHFKHILHTCSVSFFIRLLFNNVASSIIISLRYSSFFRVFPVVCLVALHYQLYSLL